jgi:hypothetical protein
MMRCGIDFRGAFCYVGCPVTTGADTTSTFATPTLELDMKARFLLIATLVLLPATAQARHHHRVTHHQSHRIERLAVISPQAYQSDDPRYPSQSYVISPMGRGHLKQERPVAAHGMDLAETYLSHPAGCPARQFCACGAAVEVFGHAVRDLWPASAWYRFSRTAPGPGMVAVRSHHVFVLRSHIEGSIWMTADYNSGGHRSRLHAQSISGYTIVDPHSARYASR